MRQAYAVPQGKSAHSNTAKSPQSQQPVNNMLDSMNIQHEHGQQQPKQLQHQHDIQSTKQQQTHHAHAQQQQLTGTGGSLLHSAANIVSGAADAAETAAKVDSLSAGSTAQAKQVHKKRPLDIQAVAMPAEDCKKQRMTVGDALSGKEPRYARSQSPTLFLPAPPLSAAHMPDVLPKPFQLVGDV